jgi:hypothetical protein
MSHPFGLNRGVGEGETAISRTLTRMLVGRPLMQTELDKLFSLGSAFSGTDEQMLQFYSHAN